MDIVEKESISTTPFILSLSLFTVASLLSIFGKFQVIYGMEKAISILSHPSQVLSIILSDSLGASQFISEAVGRSLLFGAFIHLAISQLFKSKRNPSSRRRIVIGWSLVSIVINVVAIWSTQQQHNIQRLLQQ